MKDYIDPFYMEAANDDPRFESWMNGTYIDPSIYNTPEEELPF